MLNGGFLAIGRSASHVGRLSLAISADFAPYDFISVLGDISLFWAYQATPENKVTANHPGREGKLCRLVAKTE